MAAMLLLLKCYDIKKVKTLVNLTNFMWLGWRTKKVEPLFSPKTEAEYYPSTLSLNCMQNNIMMVVFGC